MIKRVKAKLYAFFFWQTRIGELLNKVYDLNIFLSYSFTEKKIKSKESFQAFLTKQYHIIEKGLALPKPRKGFGKPKTEVLIKMANIYLDRFGEDRIVNNIRETLKNYLDRNQELKENDNQFYELVYHFTKGIKGTENGGVKKITKTEIQESINIDFESFMKTRTSVRNYSSDEVLEKEVYRAIEIARFTPSVCNRQSWKVHYFGDRIKMNKLLNLQNGNNGFTKSINKLLIITADTKSFTKLESNQVFIDGGLFSMSLLLALHSQNIATCCLNTCLPYTDEKEIKKIGNIPNSERLIMMIGIGKYKDTFEVAISDRLKVEQIFMKSNS